MYFTVKIGILLFYILPALILPLAAFTGIIVFLDELRKLNKLLLSLLKCGERQLKKCVLRTQLVALILV
jgi:hypothetical protein